MNIVIWDIESSSSSTDFGSIIEIGGILVDQNLVEKERFNLRCRLPEGDRENLFFDRSPYFDGLQAPETWRLFPIRRG